MGTPLSPEQLRMMHAYWSVATYLPQLGARAAYLKQLVRDRLIDHKNYIRRYGEDMPAVRDLKWAPDPSVGGTKTRPSDTAADNA
jgi:phosphoketolase